MKRLVVLFHPLTLLLVFLFIRFEHLWVPVIVLGTAGTAYLIRTMRAAVLDELDKMYVTAARAGGLSPIRLLLKYPVRMALNPIVATLGWRLTYVISGAPIVGVVLSLPDTGPLLSMVRCEVPEGVP